MTASFNLSYKAADPAANKSIGVSARMTNNHVLTLGCLILLMPNILFAAELRPLPAAVMTAGAIGMIALTLARHTPSKDECLSRPVSPRGLFLCLALALILLILGGEGHLMFANWDWLWRDAVLADLARAPFPPAYQVQAHTFILRAPLGMYMLPALVGKATSLPCGHYALLIQNAVLLALCLYMLTVVAQPRGILVVAVFLSFSGLDALGELLLWLSQHGSLTAFAMPSHIEGWAGFQYSSVITQLFWVPNHALPAYWLTLIVMLCARRAIGLETLGLTLAASLFWSPFAFIGALPFALYLFVRDARSTVTTPRFWLAAASALCFLPVALFLNLEAAQVPHAFLLLDPTIALIIVIFLAVEIPHVACVYQVFGDLELALRPVLVVAVLVLVSLPAFKVGQANDLVMRASIPSLMILAFAFAQSLAITWHHRPGVVATGLVILIVGSITPIQEIRRSLTTRAFSISDCGLVVVWKQIRPTQQPGLENYLARQDAAPDWLMETTRGTTLQASPRGTCWPDITYDPARSIAPQPQGTVRM